MKEETLDNSFSYNHDYVASETKVNEINLSLDELVALRRKKVNKLKQKYGTSSSSRYYILSAEEEELRKKRSMKFGLTDESGLVNEKEEDKRIKDIIPLCENEADIVEEGELQEDNDFKFMQEQKNLQNRFLNDCILITGAAGFSSTDFYLLFQDFHLKKITWINKDSAILLFDSEHMAKDVVEYLASEKVNDFCWKSTRICMRGNPSKIVLYLRFATKDDFENALSHNQQILGEVNISTNTHNSFQNSEASEERFNGLDVFSVGRSSNKRLFNNSVKSKVVNLNESRNHFSLFDKDRPPEPSEGMFRTKLFYGMTDYTQQNISFEENTHNVRDLDACSSAFEDYTPTRRSVFLKEYKASSHYIPRLLSNSEFLKKERTELKEEEKFKDENKMWVKKLKAGGESVGYLKKISKLEEENFTKMNKRSVIQRRAKIIE